MKVGEIPPHPGLVPELAQEHLFSLAIQTLTDFSRRKESGRFPIAAILDQNHSVVFGNMTADCSV